MSRWFPDAKLIAWLKEGQENPSWLNSIWLGAFIVPISTPLLIGKPVAQCIGRWLSMLVVLIIEFAKLLRTLGLLLFVCLISMPLAGLAGRCISGTVPEPSSEQDTPKS